MLIDPLKNNTQMLIDLLKKNANRKKYWNGQIRSNRSFGVITRMSYSNFKMLFKVWEGVVNEREGMRKKMKWGDKEGES